MILEKLRKLANNCLKSGEKELALVYKNMISAIVNKKKSQKDALKEKDEILVLKTLRKKSLESISAFTKGNRLDLVKKEKFELSIIESFLPKELSEEETKVKIEGILERLDNKNLGLIMKELKSFDNINMKLASRIVKEKLM